MYSSLTLHLYITALDARDGDSDCEPDCDNEPDNDGCCDAADDTGTRYTVFDGSGVVGATCYAGFPGDDGDAEASPYPGLLNCNGVWRGPCADVRSIPK